MKIGFLLNITLLLCFISAQLLKWLIDGTLVHSLAQLLNTETTLFYREWVGKDGAPINQLNLDSKVAREKFEKEKKAKQKDGKTEDKQF